MHEQTMKLWERATSEPFHIIGHESMAPVEKIPEDTLKQMNVFKTKVEGIGEGCGCVGRGLFVWVCGTVGGAD